MRKVIVVFLLAVMVLCGNILYGPTVSIVPEWQRLSTKAMPISLQEDIVLVRENTVGGGATVTVEFSHDEYFYDKDIAVVVSSNNPSAKIYYTTDGSIPTKESLQYNKPITMTADEIERCVVLKAIAIDEDEQSEVLTHSYFLGRDIKERFSTDYVFSLSTDDANLYDYETGILVPGKDYDEYMLAGHGEGVIELLRPGNYSRRGRGWEKPIHVEAFSQLGERVIVQNAGLRVHGGATRFYPQKSLKLIARKEYEPQEGKFKYPFFESLTTADAYKIPIVSYDTLILSNDGNDWEAGRIRRSVLSLISKEAGFDVVTPYTAATIFVNGSYYGYSALNVDVNAQFLENLYEAPERSFDIVDGGGSGVHTEEEAIANEFNEILKCAEGGDISEIEKNFDIDSLLQYYSIETYISNADWLIGNKNIKMWRYTGSWEYGNMAKELDGRWRFILYDLDHGMNHTTTNTDYIREESAANFEMLRLMMIASKEPGALYSPIFKTLMAKPEYRDKFVNDICDLAYEHFALDNVRNTIEKVDMNSLEEIVVTTNHYDLDGDWLMKDRDNMLDFVEQRPAFILEEAKELFGYTDMYLIKTDGSCKINTLNGKTGKYFVESHVPILPTPDKREAFDYWMINGEKRTEEELLVSVKDTDDSGVVNIRAVYREKELPLEFKYTYDKGELFGFTMTNLTDKVQSTQGLYLSDNVNELKKWQFPDLNVGVGKTWEFVGKNVTAYDALLKIKLNFNPREDEMIFLSNDKGEILDYILMKS